MRLRRSALAALGAAPGVWRPGDSSIADDSDIFGKPIWLDVRGPAVSPNPASIARVKKE
jgi:hypothetical protein